MLPKRKEIFYEMIGLEYKWYALYINRHHERKVCTWISNMGVDTLLPIRSVKKIWSDRIKIIEEPLFPSYLFVKASCLEYFEILNHPSAVKYVSFGGNPAVIPEDQIGALKIISTFNIDAESSQSAFSAGEEVVIAEGPLKGTKCELIHCNRKRRFILRMDQIGYSLSISISKENVFKEVST